MAMTTLLATASVVCNDPNTVLKSSELRRAQYIAACYWWMCTNEVDKFIVCENTNDKLLGLELNHMAENNRVEFEYITFLGNTGNISRYGKGYGEGEIIKYALENSLMIKTSQGFYKISGRLTVENFHKINRKVKCNLNYFKLMSTRLNENLQVDTRFFYVQRDFYIRFLLNSYLMVDDRKNCYIEHAFYKILKYCGNTTSFPSFPQIKGFSATLGDEYSLNKKDILRMILNKLSMYKL
jgi:hypothetical protein